MVFKSLHGLASQYMRNLFTKTSQLTSRNLRNSATDLRTAKKKVNLLFINSSSLVKFASVALQDKLQRLTLNAANRLVRFNEKELKFASFC